MSEWLERLDYYAELYAAGERAQEHLRQTDLPPQTALPQDHWPATVIDHHVGVGEKEVVMGISDFEGTLREAPGTAIVEQRSSCEVKNASSGTVQVDMKVYSNDLEGAPEARRVAVREYLEARKELGLPS